MIVAAVVTITGDTQAKFMTQYQPMKMASAEALYHTASRRRSHCSPSAR